MKIDADSKAAMAAVFAGEVVATHVGPGELYDTVVKRMANGKNAVVVVPALRKNLHPRLLRALRLRRTATLTGRCPGCGGVLATTGFAHEAHCVAADDRLRRLMQRYPLPAVLGPRLVKETRGDP